MLTLTKLTPNDLPRSCGGLCPWPILNAQVIMVRKNWLYCGNIHVFSTIFYSFNKQRTLFSILSNEDEQYREIDRYMHRSCMSNRILGLNNMHYRWMAMLVFIYMSSAELWGTENKQIMKIYVSVGNWTSDSSLTNRRLRPLGQGDRYFVAFKHIQNHVVWITWDNLVTFNICTVGILSLSMHVCTSSVDRWTLKEFKSFI